MPTMATIQEAIITIYIILYKYNKGELRHE